jgi:carbon-monoxide dehydrogenase medium subunit
MIAEIAYPSTLPEAAQLLRRPNRKTAVLAGGTHLVPKQRRHLDAVVSLRDLKLNYIRSDGRALLIGAATTLQAIATASECKGLVAQAAHDTTSFNLRNSATLGGTLVTAALGNPLPVVLLALDAALTVYSPEARQSPLDSFLNYRARLIQDGALVTEVTIPLWRLVARAAFDKVARTPGDAPIVCVAASARAGIGTVTDVRIAVGGVSPVAMRLPQVEQLVEGKALTSELAEQASELAARSVTPAGDHVASVEYRREMVKVLVRRALTRAA